MASGDFVRVHKWEGLGNESGDPFQDTIQPDRTIQINGTFDGATVVIEGSNDGTNYLTLTDIDGTSLSFTSVPTQLFLIREAPACLRPRVSGGGASVSINVYLSNT